MLRIICLIAFTLMTATESAVVKREDIGKKIVSLEGEWGDWAYKSLFCDEGAYAVGFKLKVEKYQDSSDDTSANSFRLLCSSYGENDGSVAEEVSVSSEGKYGKWSGETKCAAGSYLVGFKTKVESFVGAGNGPDDTALNSVRGLCSNDKEIEPINGGRFGDWSDKWSECPDGQFVCGFNQKVEGDQGGSDDTSLNAIRLYCCNAVKFSDPTGKWELVYDCAGGQTDGEGCSVTHVLTVGVTKSMSKTISDSDTYSISVALEQELKIFNIGGSKITVTGGYAKTLTESVSNDISRTETEQIRVECTKPLLYQASVSMKQSIGELNGDYKLGTRYYVCADIGPPQCLPGLCVDSNCQECKE